MTDVGQISASQEEMLCFCSHIMKVSTWCLETSFNIVFLLNTEDNIIEKDAHLVESAPEKISFYVNKIIFSVEIFLRFYLSTFFF